MRPGYWFWLIPWLGSHSLGIVCDANASAQTMNTHGRPWTGARHQPRRRVPGGRPQGQDFLFLRHFSHGCRQVFSGRRWALTGEAGVFLDPFYSPGSDFIAISNTYIAELVRLDFAGEPIGLHADLFQQLYFSFYRNTLTLYQDQYPVFGTEVMPAKVLWDYAYYWSLLAPLFFGTADRLPVLGRLRPLTRGAPQPAMQALRDWGCATRAALAPRALDQYRWTGAGDECQLTERLTRRLLERTARDVAACASSRAGAGAGPRVPDLDDHGLDALLPATAAHPPPPAWLRAAELAA